MAMILALGENGVVTHRGNIALDKVWSRGSEPGKKVIRIGGGSVHLSKEDWEELKQAVQQEKIKEATNPRR